jgi:N-acetylmuramoyl-L-alanine amidase
LFFLQRLDNPDMGKFGPFAAWGLPLRLRYRMLKALMAISSLLIVPLTVVKPAWAEETEQTRRDPEPSKCDRSQFRVILDVGHTAEAPGAISARNVPEYQFNARLAAHIERSLIEDGFDKTVLLITAGSGRATLFDRVAKANGLSANLFVSIHHDSVPDSLLENWKFEGKESHFSDRFSGHSIFVSYENPHLKESLLFGRLLGNELKDRGLQYARQYTQPIMGDRQRELVDPDAGVYRYDQLIVLKATLMPAVLFEAGSIINREEELQISSAERLDLIGASLTAAVRTFCNLSSSR